ncbi:MAG: RNA methyltransferase [Candidatus Kaiserbacteria bacterium]|nr:RNA methyltransferase [Candidatus Kaiserbacteria bacterium]
MELAILLHNIRSAHNVGSIFRTADAAGVAHIYLTGYTPLPIDRFGRPQKDIAKTALGAEKSVEWEASASPAALITRLKRQGFTVVALEQEKRSIPYTDFRAGGKTLFIFGNEVRGVSKALRDCADVILEIPMRGTKESLNVSVAAGIALFSAINN